MEIYRPPAARLLRYFRERNELTLQNASRLLGMSAAALSRKERGEKPVQRADIRSAIEAYCLTPREAHELWLAAGLIPEQREPHLSTTGVYGTAAPLLCDVAYPACITDSVGYIKVWNSEYEALWHLTDTDAEPHCVEQLWQRKDLFSSHESWRRCALQTMRAFYNQMMRTARELELEAVLQRLRKSYGEEFAHCWDWAQSHAVPFNFWNGAAARDEISIFADQGMVMMHQATGASTDEVASFAPADLAPVSLVLVGSAPESHMMTSPTLSTPAAAGIKMVDASEPFIEIEYITVRSMVDLLADYEMTIYIPYGGSNQKRYAQWRQHIDSGRVYSA